MKLYRFRVWEGSALVRDLRPALDGERAPCLWDAVTEQFYRNAGSGSFLYG